MTSIEPLTVYLVKFLIDVETKHIEVGIIEAANSLIGGIKVGSKDLKDGLNGLGFYIGADLALLGIAVAYGLTNHKSTVISKYFII